MSADGRQFERRTGERRHARSRGARAHDLPAEESWFGVVGVSGEGDDTAAGGLGGDAAEAGSTRSARSRSTDAFPASEAGEGKGEGGTSSDADARFLSRQARRIVNAGQTTFERIYGAFIAARVVLGVALVLTQVVAGALGVRPAPEVMIACGLYAALAIGVWLWPKFHQGTAEAAAKVAYLRRSQWLATIGVDVVVFSLLHVATPPGHLSYVALLVLPVLMAGVLTPRLMALATAAGVTLVMLAHALFEVAGGVEAAPVLTQTGLTGAGFFIVTLLAANWQGAWRARNSRRAAAWSSRDSRRSSIAS